MTGRAAFRHRTGALPLGARTLVMGIVNVTPDSFSDGGVHERPGDAVAGALRLAREGADILDIGAESTRPGHRQVGAGEEWERLAPVLAGLSGVPGLPPVSVDTWKADVARRALLAGASIVNDVWGFQRDPAIAAVAAEHGAGVVLMHNRHEVDPGLDIVSDMLAFLERSAALAAAAGVPEDAIALDPGIGFGKSLEQNYRALAALPRLKALGFPILLGVSRKSFIGRLFDPQPAPAHRVPGTVAANAYGALHGADILRVHDVAAAVQAARVVDAIRAASAP